MTARIESAGALRLGGLAALANAVVAPIGLVFLVAMYAAFGAGARSEGLAFGWVNDVLAIVSGVLMLPVALAVHRLLGPSAPAASRLAFVIGVGANLAIVVLQSLLVRGTLTFEQEIGPVLIAFLFLVIWFVLTGFLGSSTGLLPNGLRMSFLAATYVGYPIWAFWLGRHLLRAADGPSLSRRVATTN
jgi:hypothetical protein